MDQLKSMAVFVQVVATGSFIAASKATGTSRPMASKHVQNLEDELGVRLLNRTTRRISLTEAGRLFHLRCLKVFEEIDAAIAEAGNMQVQPKGVLRINAPVTFGKVHLVKALASFQEEYPLIDVDLTLNDRVVDIVDEGYDLAIRIGVLSDSSLVARKLAPCQMVVCASPRYLQKRASPAHPGELSEHNCLLYSYFADADRWRFRDQSETQEVQVSGDFRSNFGEAVVEAAVAGRGVVLEPSFSVAPYISSGKLVPLLTGFEPAELNIYAVYPPSRLLPAKIRVLIDHLAAAFDPDPYWDRVNGLSVNPR